MHTSDDAQHFPVHCPTCGAESTSDHPVTKCPRCGETASASVRGAAARSGPPVPTGTFVGNGLGDRLYDSNWGRRVRSMRPRTQRIVGGGGLGLFLLGIVFMATTQTPYCAYYVDGTTSCGGSVLHTFGITILILGIALLIIDALSFILQSVERSRRPPGRDV
jgi:hypothetical protein